mmetsp:Transcript_92195/g.256883  ORF Transcript_92195/g.256883 Transcript_92195/m.256883 type:complete len:209 (-) Transcript_92195:276-902(-)
MIARIAICTSCGVIRGASCSRGGCPMCTCAHVCLARALLPIHPGPYAGHSGALINLDVAARGTIAPWKVGDRHARSLCVALSLALVQGSIACEPPTWIADAVAVFLVAAGSPGRQRWLWCGSRRLALLPVHAEISAGGLRAFAGLDVAARGTVEPRSVGDRHASTLPAAPRLASVQGRIACRSSRWGAHGVAVFFVAASDLLVGRPPS